jgi:hypothetical protein
MGNPRRVVLLIKLEDDSVSMYILVYKGQDVVKYAWSTKKMVVVINYSLSASQRGKGYGKKIVEAGERQALIDYPTAAFIEAYEKFDNPAICNNLSEMRYNEQADSVNKAYRFYKIIIRKVITGCSVVYKVRHITADSMGGQNDWLRVDANEHIATGHMMRCLTIASTQQELGHEVKFNAEQMQKVSILRATKD